MDLFNNFCLGFAALMIMDLFTYWLIREMIISIIWCETGGKYNKLKKRLAGKRINRLLQNYDISVIKYKKQFLFWKRFKRVFVFAELIMAVLFIFSAVLFKSLILCSLILIQACVIFIVVGFQFDSGKNTKYDRIRMNK